MSRFPGSLVVGLFRRQTCIKIGPWNEMRRRHQDWEFGIRFLSLREEHLISDDVGYIVNATNDDRVTKLGVDIENEITLQRQAADAAEAAVQGRNAPLDIRKKCSAILKS